MDRTDGTIIAYFNGARPERCCIYARLKQFNARANGIRKCLEVHSITHHVPENKPID